MKYKLYLSILFTSLLFIFNTHPEINIEFRYYFMITGFILARYFSDTIENIKYNRWLRKNGDPSVKFETERFRKLTDKMIEEYNDRENKIDNKKMIARLDRSLKKISESNQRIDKLMEESSQL